MDAGSGRLQAWERDFIEGQRVARLGTVGRKGRPHLVPVCFALVGDEVFVAIDEKPKRAGKLARVANIEREPRCTLLFDHYSDNWERLAWVRLDCQGAILERGTDHPEALAMLRGRYLQYERMALEELPLLRFTVERVVSWRWGG